MQHSLGLPILLAVSLSVAASAVAATGPLTICLKQSTGAIKAKTRCGRGETALTLSFLQSQTTEIPGPQGPTGPTGDTGPAGPPAAPALNVYDANGNLLGPLLHFDPSRSVGQMLFPIDGTNYWISFTHDTILSAPAKVLFSLPDCAGTPYAAENVSGHSDEFFHPFSGLGGVAVGLPDRTLYVPKLPRLEAFDYSSYSSGPTNGVFTCVNAGGAPVTKSGFELIAKGSVDDTFLPPFDVKQ